MNIIHKQSLFAILFALTLISSCSNNLQNDSIKINALNEGLMNSNSLIHDQLSTLYKSMEDKLLDNHSKDKAIAWYPKAMAIKMYSIVFEIL